MKQIFFYLESSTVIFNTNKKYTCRRFTQSWVGSEGRSGTPATTPVWSLSPHPDGSHVSFPLFDETEEGGGEVKTGLVVDLN